MSHNGTKRYPMVLKQKEILELLRRGIYYLDEQTADGQPRLLRGGREVGKVMLGRSTQRDSERQGKRAWVRLYWEGKRKQIVLARLVWMAHTGSIIPKGFRCPPPGR